MLVTGHSLGGAAASMAAVYNDAQTTLTFGTPKVFGTNGSCHRTLGQSHVVYTRDSVLQLADPISAVGPLKKARHCEESVWELARSGRLSRQTSTDPPYLIGTVRLSRWKTIHPMEVSYVPYLTATASQPQTV